MSKKDPQPNPRPTILLLEDITFLESAEYELTPGRVEEGRGGVPLHILGSISGKMGMAGVPTGNNRRYSPKLMQSNIDRLAETIAARGLYGELDHPQDGKTRFQRVSHIVTGLKLEQNGEIRGSWDILDTPNGRIQMAVCKARGRLGASTRGTGTTISGADGVEDVSDDYRLITVDGVVDPAARDAFPDLVKKAKDLSQFEEMVVTYELLRKEAPGLAEELKDQVIQEHSRVLVQVPEQIAPTVEALRKEFQEGLDLQRRALPGVVIEAASRIREEVAGEANRRAKAAEDRAKAAEAEAASARRQAESLAGLGARTSLLLLAERRLAGRPWRDAAMSALGDPDRHGSREAWEKAVGAVAEQMEKAHKDNEDKGSSLELEKERTGRREDASRHEREIGESRAAHEKEVKDLRSRHEVEMAEARATSDAERRRAEDLSRKYDELLAEARRVEREAMADEKRYEERIRILEAGRTRLEEELAEERESAERRVEVERMLAGRRDGDRLRALTARAKTVEEAAAIIAENARGTPERAPSRGPKGVQDVEREPEGHAPVGAALSEEFSSLGVDEEEILSRMQPDTVVEG